MYATKVTLKRDTQLRSPISGGLKWLVFGGVTLFFIARAIYWTWHWHGSQFLRWPMMLVCAIAALLILLNFRHWVEGVYGLDQWPDPHGRYYDLWLALPDGYGDYYEWLSQQMGTREPWKKWAEMDRQITTKTLKAQSGNSDTPKQLGS